MLYFKKIRTHGGTACAPQNVDEMSTLVLLLAPSIARSIFTSVAASKP